MVCPQCPRLLLESSAAARELLLQTERIKDEMLARIDAVKTLVDIKEIDESLREL